MKTGMAGVGAAGDNVVVIDPITTAIADVGGTGDHKGSCGTLQVAPTVGLRGDGNGH